MPTIDRVFALIQKVFSCLLFDVWLLSCLLFKRLIAKRLRSEKREITVIVLFLPTSFHLQITTTNIFFLACLDNCIHLCCPLWICTLKTTSKSYYWVTSPTNWLPSSLGLFMIGRCWQIGKHRRSTRIPDLHKTTGNSKILKPSFFCLDHCMTLCFRAQPAPWKSSRMSSSFRSSQR